MPAHLHSWKQALAYLSAALLCSHAFAAEIAASQFVTAFSRIRENAPQTFTLVRPVNIDLPAGYNRSIGPFPKYHQEGIQKTPDGTFYVSGSADQNGYFYVANGGRIHTVIQPAPREFNHAGGFQITDGILAVGLEQYEAGAQGGSKVFFYDVRNPRNIAPLPHLTVLRTPPNNTAGAVALVRTAGRWRLIVGNWGSARIDIYQSNSPDLFSSTTRFVKLGSWADSVNHLDPNSVDRNWSSYEHINAFCDVDNTVWFVGMHTGSRAQGMPDWADLYQIRESGGRFNVIKRWKKHFTAHNGPRFMYGAGVVWNANSRSFEVYACAPHLSGTPPTVNICNKWN